jgi:hypothetical protein
VESIDSRVGGRRGRDQGSTKEGWADENHKGIYQGTVRSINVTSDLQSKLG